MARRRREQPLLVTSAPRSHRADIQYREQRYLLVQLGRMVCLLAAVVLPVPIPGRVALIALACVLPLMGVVAANAPSRHRARRRAPAPLAAPLPLAALPASRVIDAEAP